MRTTTPIVVCLINLGCAKNQVDAECLLGNLIRAGFLLAEKPADADICLVNTCGFIQPARAETAAVLRELADLKKRGWRGAIAAMGCLVRRAQAHPQFESFLAEADARITFADYPRMAEICRALAGAAAVPAAAGRSPRSYLEFLRSPRLRIGGAHTAWLKISEGCSNPCRFCSIPQIRGRQVSRPIAAIVSEARQLIAAGAREIGLIAQDTTSYGRDLFGKPALHRLLVALRKLPDDVWFRLMYAYPRHLSDAVLDTLHSDPRFCPYIDLPLQHISDRMLAAMGRGMGRAATERLLERIAARLPGAAIRTTFIVGYPGETEADFEELCAFVDSGHFTHAGVFTYSAEAGTPAAKQADDVKPAEKERRRRELMRIQLRVARRRNRARVGERVTVLVDARVRARGRGVPPGVSAVGRSQLEAPEVDGVIYIRGAPRMVLRPGMRLDATIVGARDYDLIAQ